MQWYTYQKHKPSLILVWRTMKQSTKKPLARTVRELPSAVKRSSKVTIILGSNNRIYLIIAHLRINQPRSHKFLCCYTMNDNVCKSMRKEIGLSIYSSKFFQRICRNTISRFFDIGPHQSLRFLWNFISINPPLKQGVSITIRILHKLTESASFFILFLCRHLIITIFNISI